MAKATKRVKSNYDGLDRQTLYSLEDAIKEVKKRASCKFAETVEMAMNLGVDPKKGDQNVRGMVRLPHSFGKDVRVAVFAKGPKADEAKSAGADIVGAEDLMEEIQQGNINFDRCVATPDMMGLVGRVAQVLGPKGLMPNPKLGTVTMDVAKAVEDAKAGQIQYRIDKNGIIHAGVAKVDMDDKKITENILSFVDAVVKAKPASSKSEYIRRVTLSSTMGPGIKLDVAELRAAA